LKKIRDENLARFNRMKEAGHSFWSRADIHPVLPLTTPVYLFFRVIATWLERHKALTDLTEVVGWVLVVIGLIIELNGSQKVKQFDDAANAAMHGEAASNALAAANLEMKVERVRRANDALNPDNFHIGTATVFFNLTLTTDQIQNPRTGDWLAAKIETNGAPQLVITLAAAADHPKQESFDFNGDDIFMEQIITFSRRTMSCGFHLVNANPIYGDGVEVDFPDLHEELAGRIYDIDSIELNIPFALYDQTVPAVQGYLLIFFNDVSREFSIPMTLGDTNHMIFHIVGTRLAVKHPATINK
jgi:hypothetical protein